jgi:hypothetical protein
MDKLVSFRHFIKESYVLKSVTNIIPGIGREGVDWMHQTQDRDQCQALVNTILTFELHKMRIISCLPEQLLVLRM